MNRENSSITLVTGASRGIGRALVELALEAGQTVLAVSRSSEALATLEKKHPKNLTTISADVSTEAGREHVVKIVKKSGGLDTLINNAGVFKKSDTEKDFTESFHLNAIVPFLLTKDLAPFLKASKNPKVVQISTMMSSIADNSSGGHYAYRSSKSALNMITKSLAHDHEDITFGLIHPGWVKTEMGGPEAPVATSDSAKGIWKVIDQLSRTPDVKLIDYRGRELPW